VQPIELLVGDEPLLIEPKHSVLVNESNAHLACALAGLGLVHTLDFMVRPSIEKGQLIVVLPEYSPKPLEVFVVLSTESSTEYEGARLHRVGYANL
jgi:DNA-binding transcriptional LysR family regulator